MRNIQKYPITKDEIILVLQKEIQKELTSDEVGSITGIALQLALTIVEKSNFVSWPMEANSE